MANYTDPTDRLDPEGQALLEELIEQRGSVGGMYRTMLLNPELSRNVSDFATYLRFGSSALSDRHRELTILRVARRTGTSYEWVMHESPAREAGIPDEVIRALGEGRTPAGLDPVERDILEVIDLALDHEPLPDGLHESLVAGLGEPGAIELVILAGFYAGIAGFLKAFSVPVPEGMTAPF